MNKFLPDIWIWKLVKEMGSGVPPVVEKGDNREEAVTPARAVVEAYVEAYPFEPFGRRGMTTTERILGRPFETNTEKVDDAGMLW